MARSGSRFTWRVALLAAVLILGTIGVIARLAFLQIVDHQHYLASAESEHLDKQVVRSSRGAILDRNGFPLATSVDVWDLYVDSRAWHDDPTKVQKVAVALSPVLQESVADLSTKLQPDPKAPIKLLSSDLDYDAGVAVQGMNLPGVTLAQASQRFYPEGDLASDVLGFLGTDHSGLAGLEADLDDVLGGTPGALYFERDAAGNPIAFGQSRVDPGKPGSDVKLTIDRYIQKLCEDELDFEIKAHSASGGQILVMDPKTGAILAMASRPSFKLSTLNLNDPNFANYRDRAVTDLYEPGSVDKTLTMATALDLGLVTPNTTYYDSGLVVKDGYEFRNWDFSTNGTQTMTQVLQKSLNTGAIWLSDQIGPDRLYSYLQRFGYGESTHSGLGGESSGIVRTNQDPEWSPTDLYTNSYGQGIAATPLQVITAVSSLINGGHLMRPYIVSEIDGPNGVRKFDPVVVRQTISPQTSATMVEMMHQVVDGVPGHGAQVKGYDVGGKTGTTLVSIPTGYDLDSTIATFVGFAPVEDPAMIMLVKIDQPKDDPLGGIVAAPVFGKLAPQILHYLGVLPNNALATSKP